MRAAREGDEEVVQLCPAFVVEARYRTMDGQRWGRVICFTDPDGRQHRLQVLDRDLASHPQLVLATMADKGFELPFEKSERDLLLKLIRTEGELKRVGTIARVRRAFYVQGWSLKKIVRDLHVSRNTVRKILRSDETDFTYERDHQPMPRIGPWQQKLDEFLQGNAGKPPRERLTLIRIFEELRAVGYEGGYDAVRRFARSWSETRGAVTAEAYVPLTYDPGEAYQFDWR